MIADYECMCSDPLVFGGRNCSVELLGCRGDPCANGGFCTPELILESPGEFRVEAKSLAVVFLRVLEIFPVGSVVLGPRARARVP